MARTTSDERGPRGMSARTLRLRALAPRIAFYGLVGILAVAGLRAALAPAEEPVAAPRVESQASDLGAESFAEAFARTYLTWQADGEDERERLLAPFLPSTLDADAGLAPPEDGEQEVEWTAVAGSHAERSRTIVTVAAETSNGTLHLSVPVGRDPRGFLYVAGYPALVGPPAVNRRPPRADEDEVEDRKLAAVVERALTNYLARARGNLLADLTPDAVVSLPVQALRVASVDEVTWVRPNRRTAVVLEAEDERGGSWTLRYELEVRKRDRWYVRSLQVDPTFRGGR
jgi:conjugative transposon protein TcpC